ncbi:MAG: hypothetical protein RR412_02175 [Burkholderiaceae bacterium]
MSSAVTASLVFRMNAVSKLYRVNVVADLEHAAPGLGDGYRIEARILVDQRPAVLVVPSGRYLARLRARSWPRGGP